MRSLYRFVLFALALSASLAAAPPAATAADNIGEAGRVASFQVRFAASDDQSLAIVELVLVELSTGEDRTYRISPLTYCPGDVFTDAEIDRLARAVSIPKVIIEPRWRAGNAVTRCLTGFRITDKKHI